MRVSDLIRAGHVVIWDCEVCQRIGPVDLIGGKYGHNPHKPLDDCGDYP